ncbi:hypothetical protein [Bradyrhizobium sp. WSM1417]|uniref:hypothetical protein n=1 Tax=Bradyrhizobium sp. WSM1417 TaxID=754500 RepID=UPI000567EDC2|nr:hypothetical protein [Bradyrhizobium sp. WSM1417]
MDKRAEKPPGDRRTIPAYVYYSMMRLSPEDQFDREKVNAAAQQRQEWVWIYEDGHKHIGNADWIKVFATEEAASAWFAENDPEGVVWSYPIETET